MRGAMGKKQEKIGVEFWPVPHKLSQIFEMLSLPPSDRN